MDDSDVTSYSQVFGNDPSNMPSVVVANNSKFFDQYDDTSPTKSSKSTPLLDQLSQHYDVNSKK